MVPLRPRQEGLHFAVPQDTMGCMLDPNVPQASVQASAEGEGDGGYAMRMQRGGPVSRQGPSSNLPLRRPRGACPRRLPRLGSRRRGPGRRRQGAAGSVPPPRAQSQLPGTGSGYSPGVSGC